MVSISIGCRFDWVANSVGPVINNGRRGRLLHGHPDPDRPYYFLGWSADVPSGFRAAKVRQTVDGGPALPGEQIVTLGRRRAALQVRRPAGPEACENDHRNSMSPRPTYFVPRGREILMVKNAEKKTIIRS